MKRFVSVLFVFVAALSLLSSCKGTAELGPDVAGLPNVHRDVKHSDRLVVGTSFGSDGPETKSVVYNGSTGGYGYANWLIVLYNDDGSRVESIDGIDSDGNEAHWYYPAFHSSDYTYDVDNENELGSSYNNNLFGMGFKYNEELTDYAYYKVYVVLNLPIDDWVSVQSFYNACFPEQIDDFDEFESNLSFDFSGFEYDDVSGYGAMSQMGGRQLMVAKSQYASFRFDDSSSYLEGRYLFNTFTLTINDNDDEILGGLNLEESQIHNIPKSIKPFSANYIENSGQVMYHPEVCSVSFQDILTDSEKGSFYSSKTVRFLLPDSRPGESSFVGDESQRSLEFLEAVGEDELGKSAIFVEARFDLSSSSRFGNSGTLILRGYPQNSGSDSYDFNIIADQSSYLTWNVDYNYIKTSDYWLVELLADERHMYAEWTESDFEYPYSSQTSGGVVKIGEGESAGINLYNTIRSYDPDDDYYYEDIIIRLRSNDGDFEFETTWGDIVNDFDTSVGYAETFIFYHYDEETLAVCLPDDLYWAYDVGAYYDPYETYFIIEFEDPRSHDKCQLYFSGDYYTDGPYITSGSLDNLFVAQKRQLSSSKYSTWEVIDGSAGVTSSTGNSTYLEAYGPGFVTLRVSDYYNSSSYRDYRFLVKEPKLQIRFDGGDWADAPWGQVSTPDFYIDDATKYIEYRYVHPTTKDAIIFDSSLYDSHLRLNTSGNSSYGVSNGFIGFSRSNSSYAYYGGGYDRFTINVNSLENNSGNRNIFMYLAQGEPNLFSIVLYPGYNSGKQVKWVANMIHPLSRYLNSGLSGDCVDINVNVVYNNIYIANTEYVGGYDLVPVTLYGDAGIFVNCRDQSHVEFTFTPESGYSGKTHGYVTRYDIQSVTGGYYLSDFKTAINHNQYGDLYFGFRFTNDNGNSLYLYNGSDYIASTDMSTRMKLVVGVDMNMGLERRSDVNTILFAPCYRNYNNVYPTPRSKIGTVLKMDKRNDQYDISQFGRFSGYCETYSLFNNVAVTDLDNNKGIAFFKMVKDYNWYGDLYGYMEASTIYTWPGGNWSYDMSGGLTCSIYGTIYGIDRSRVSGASCSIHDPGHNGFLYYYSFYNFYNCFVMDTDKVTPTWSYKGYPTYSLNSDSDIVIVDFRPTLSVSYY